MSTKSGQLHSPLAVGGAGAVLLGVAAFAVLGRGGDPVADWESGEAALELGLEDRVLVQRGLLESGYDPGEWDGLLGTGTRVALREWQSARDLEPTGYLTAAMVEVLRIVGEQGVADSVAEAGRVVAEAERAADSIARAVAEAQREAEAARQAEEQRFADELHFLIEAAESDDHFSSLGAWSGNFYEQLLGPYAANSYGIDMSYVPASYDECELTLQLYGCNVECDSRRHGRRRVRRSPGDPHRPLRRCRRG